MRKALIIISAILLCSTAFAQHKELKAIDLDPVYISQSGSSKSNNIGNTRESYSSHFYVGTCFIQHQKGIQDPDIGYDVWTINASLDYKEKIALELYATKKEEFHKFYSGTSLLHISVGGTIYEISSWYYSESSSTIMLDINKEICKHISISGLQSVLAKEIGIIAFSDIDQELWRRAAFDVYTTRKDL